ncbi:unnamed protein product [Adineta ricciae]|uniref:G-protein coupled receptors family 1 profile domain-containing protein n=1 Tax=Adineta ricciae TaxID=249248 RepID=A0A814URN1_ADIRI|nr:unnamed protein product [Adineta ricciae]
MDISDETYYITNLNNAVVYLNKYILIVFYVLGNIGNLLSIWIFMKKSWRKNVCVLYFKVSLVISTCYLNSAILGAISNFGFQVYLQNSSVIICKIHYYVSILLSVLAPTILLLASIDRLLISSQNVDTRLYSSKRLAYFSISVGITFWSLFFIHILVKIDIHQISPMEFVCSYISPKWYYDFVTYSLGVINVIVCLLMIILCLFAFKNVQRIRAAPQGKHAEIRSMTKKDFQVLRCLFVQDVIYIFFSMVVIIYYVYAAITTDRQRTALGLAIVNFVDKFVTFLFNITYSTYFFVFVAVSRAFRMELKRLIRKSFTSIHDEENRPNIPHKSEHAEDVVDTIEIP